MGILETTVNVLLALVLLWRVRSRLRALFEAAPTFYSLVVLVAATLLLLGQAFGRGGAAAGADATFPLTDWAMHTSSVGADPEVIEYVAVFADGRRERVLLARLFAGLGKKFRARIDEALRGLDGAGSDVQRRDAEARLYRNLDLIAEALERRPSGVAVEEIEIWRRTISALDYRGATPATRVVLPDRSIR